MLYDKATAGCGVWFFVGVSVRKRTAPVALILGRVAVLPPPLATFPSPSPHVAHSLVPSVCLAPSSLPPARPPPRIASAPLSPCAALFFWASHRTLHSPSPRRTKRPANAVITDQPSSRTRSATAVPSQPVPPVVLPAATEPTAIVSAGQPSRQQPPSQQPPCQQPPCQQPLSPQPPSQQPSCQQPPRQQPPSQ